MVDEHPENDVSQSVGAWEGRSTKTIRNCLRQLSCWGEKKVWSTVSDELRPYLSGVKIPLPLLYTHRSFYKCIPVGDCR